LIPFVVLLAVAAGCLDDPDGPYRRWTNNTPVNGEAMPTLDNIWPNADQTEWTFYFRRITANEWPQGWYPTPEDVPPLPTWDQVKVYLSESITADSLSWSEGTYRMWFDGERTTAAGVTAQNLLVDIAAVGGTRADLPPPGGPRAELARRLSLVRQRPDSRTELVEPIAQPLFIHGGAWKKTHYWIGTYDDESRDPAWKFLTNDLKPGSEFTHQLIPDLADNVFLHGRVDRRFDYVTGKGIIHNCLECYYLIDYGLSEVYTVEGQVLGFQRWFAYGRVVYAPEIGPLSCLERTIATADEPVGKSEWDLVGLGLEWPMALKPADATATRNGAP
jgi:hypothetical protein